MDTKGTPTSYMSSQTADINYGSLNSKSRCVYFSFLKYVGMFPFDLKNLSNDKNTQHSKAKVDRDQGETKSKISPTTTGQHRIKENQDRFNQNLVLTPASWKFVSLNRVLLVWYVLYYAFLLCQMIRSVPGLLTVHDEDKGPANSSYISVVRWSVPKLVKNLSAVGWAIRIHTTFAMFLLFYTKKQALSDLINRWYVVECELRSWVRQHNQNQRAVGQTGSGNVNSYTAQWAIFFLVYTLALLFMVGSLANQLLYPRHVIYIYSLLPQSMELPWFHVLSIIINQGAYMISILHSIAFFIFMVIFPVAIVECLRLLSGNVGTGTDTIVSITQDYDELKALVEEFNVIFAGYFMHLKATSMINLCLLIYLPLHYLSKLPILGLIVFLPGAACAAVNLCFVLRVMGAVYTESVHLKEEVGRAVAVATSVGWLTSRTDSQLFGLQPGTEVKAAVAWSSILGARDRLQQTLPIQFRCGHFYYVYPCTILTFFSVVTSYVIVLLQIDTGSE